MMFFRSKSLPLLPLSLFTSLAIASAYADEGMWLFNHLPVTQLQEKYGFTPTDQWIDHVMKASVRFSSGGSGAFVSPEGLVLTNHHIAAGTLESVSSEAKNYLSDGFYAKTQEEELKAPNLEVIQLVKIQDVTAEVNSVVLATMPSSEALEAKQAKIGEIEKNALAATGLKSNVVKLYGGGQYHLYQYEKYTDVRIVFAPEARMAFFGGDPDNFEFPRYDLDMAILRVYKDGKPANTENFFKWSEKGAQPEELVFVSGNPGSTNRMFTVADLQFMKNTSLLTTVQYLERLQKLLQEYSSQSTESERRAHQTLFSIQNNLKVYRGQFRALQETTILADKVKEEASMKNLARSKPELTENLGAWDDLAQAEKVAAEIYSNRMIIEQGRGFNTGLYSRAKTIVRISIEDLKPNGLRLPEYQEAGRARLLQDLYSEEPLYADFEQVQFGNSLAYLEENLGTTHEVYEAVFAGKSPKDRAAELLSGTKLWRAEERKKLLTGTPAEVFAAVSASQDPMIQLALSVEPFARKYRTQYDSKVKAVEDDAYGKIAKILFAVKGTDTYPDATFTPRLAYGTVRGYSDTDGTSVPAWTTLDGAFEHEAARGGKDPFALPASWHSEMANIRLDTPLNFVSTADTIGGNSGSPVINKKAELVGLNFDRNRYRMGTNFGYTEVQGRHVSVDSRGMLEALRSIYHANELVDALTSGR